MVHTAKFFLKLKVEDISNLTNKHSENITLIGSKIDEKYNWASTSIFFSRSSEEQYGMNSWVMSLVVDFVKMLNKSNIEESDYSKVEEYINDYMFNLFGNLEHELTIVRIDYRMDIKMDKRDREVLLNLYKKSYQSYGFNKIKKIKNIDTSIYFQSKSISILIYDKEQERKDKGKEIKKIEENVLRMEVALLNSHLNYQKRNHNISKDLSIYFNKNFYEKYMNEKLVKFIHKGNHYKIDVAEKIIQSSEIKDKDKIFLRDFLIDVSRSNLTSILKLKNDKGKDKYYPSKRRKALKMLEILNINPILIPRNWKCKSCIENPIYKF
ncbi:hypothetical protein KD33_10960 [Clostridium sp. NCR]|nr:hypothetical protein KD33_10960 [Clostridium sp. NCR]